MNEDANTGKSAGGTGVWNEQLSPTYLLALTCVLGGSEIFNHLLS